ncbi:MAG: hypothetical protein ACOC8E_08950 [Planctomycetota bacterium]
MRPLICYILIVVAAAVVGMFFVCQHSRQVTIGYELNRLRHERSELLEHRRKLKLLVAEASEHDQLVEAAQRHGLVLEPPDSEEQVPR